MRPAVETSVVSYVAVTHLSQVETTKAQISSIPPHSSSCAGSSAGSCPSSGCERHHCTMPSPDSAILAKILYPACSIGSFLLMGFPYSSTSSLSCENAGTSGVGLTACHSVSDIRNRMGSSLSMYNRSVNQLKIHVERWGTSVTRVLKGSGQRGV